MKQIPIWSRNKETKKSYVKCYAMVDDEDFEWLNSYRWNLNQENYVIRNMKSSEEKYRKVIAMHKQIMEKYNVGYNSRMKVDHVNVNTLDNQKSNLRLCTNQENCMNKKVKVGTSKFKGVSRHGNGFQAQIKHNWKNIYIGFFKDEASAALAYNKKAKELFGEYARLNEVIAL